MEALDIRRDATLDAGVRDELARVVAHLERQFPHLPPPIVLACSDHPVVGLDGDTPWLYAFARHDPLLGENGVAVLPRPQRRQLQRIAATGARFDAVAVAHELDTDGPVRTLLPLLADGPRTCTDEVARALVRPVPAHPGVARAAGMLDALCGGDALAWAGEALDRLLDPIIFGVLAPFGLVHGAPAVFAPLVAWRW
jgi:hypothetical protein